MNMYMLASTITKPKQAERARPCIHSATSMRSLFSGVRSDCFGLLFDHCFGLLFDLWSLFIGTNLPSLARLYSDEYVSSSSNFYTRIPGTSEPRS